MSSSNLDRAARGPSLFEIIFGIALSILLGGLLALVWLVFKPVSVVKVIPKDASSTTVYYIEGSKGSSNRGWLNKRSAFIEGQTVTLTEDDMLSAVATQVEKPKAPAPAADGILVPGQPNFRIAGGQLQMALPIKSPVLELQVIVQVRGVFEKRGEVFKFVPQQFYVGSCPLHRLPLVESFLLNRLYATQNFPEDMQKAWARLSAVTLEPKALKLVGSQ